MSGHLRVTESHEDLRWAHYMGCQALADIELLAEMLGCREDQVIDRVRTLVRRRLW